MHTDLNKVPSAAATGRLAPALAALALGLALPLGAQAAEAMRVVRDPVTGELRAPTASEAAAMKKAEAQLRAKNAKISKSSRGSGEAPAQLEIVHPDGTVELPLDEDSQMFSVVRANEDGSLAMQCLPAKEAKAWVASGGKKAAMSKSNAGKAAAKGHEGHNHD